MQATPPSLADAAEQLAAAGRIPEAVLLLNRLASAGDAAGLHTLAMWRLAGTRIPRDVPQSRELFRRAGEAGHPQSAKIYLNFLAAGTGGAADWKGAVELLKTLARRDPTSRVEIDIIRKMDLKPDGSPKGIPAPETLSQAPFVQRIPRLFTPAECDYLARAAEPMLTPSVVIDERSGRQVPHPIRTSEGTAFPWVILNPAVQALNLRIAAASGTGVSQGEPLQILRYRPGQQYRNHLDAVVGLDNRRIMTVIVYLNEGFGGGETRFTKAGIDFRGRKGDALLFRNTLPDGRADPLTEHAGLPVTSGVKLIATRWIWEKPFAPPPPRLAGQP